MTEDFEIILEVLAGDRNAYAQLVRKYEVRVRGYCLSMLFNGAQAEDAAQEIFIKAFYGLGKFREAIVLREMEGLSYQEIAETLECTVDAVKARLKRTRQELELEVRHLLPVHDV